MLGGDGEGSLCWGGGHPSVSPMQAMRPPYLAPVGVLHDEAEAVVGLEGVLQGLRGKQSGYRGPWTRPEPQCPHAILEEGAVWALYQISGPLHGRQGSSWGDPRQGEDVPRAELTGHFPTSHHRGPGSKRKGPDNRVVPTSDRCVHRI